MIETILLATDGSAIAEDAERVAVQLAQRLSAKLRGVSVVEQRWLRRRNNDSLNVPLPAMDGLESYLKARSEASLRRFSERARQAGVEVITEAASGTADDLIVERGDSADLIVIGRDGEDAPYRSALIGSTASGVIRKSQKPVLVVPKGARFDGPILLAFDGSPGSRLAANLAIELASKQGIGVHIFVDSKDKGRASARFDEIRRLLGSLTVPMRETASTLGRPDMKIIDAARDAGAGVIVMGAFGRNRINEYFIGSNAAAVIRNSPIPVLLAR